METHKKKKIKSYPFIKMRGKIRGRASRGMVEPLRRCSPTIKQIFANANRPQAVVGIIISQTTKFTSSRRKASLT